MMLRKFGMFAAIAMICAPLGGVRVAMAKGSGLSLPLSFTGSWLLEPAQLVTVCACLVVLSLAASRRWL